jgi:sulfur carrier protein
LFLRILGLYIKRIYRAKSLFMRFLREIGGRGRSDNLKIRINGQPRDFQSLQGGVSLEKLLETLELKADRIAVELNGSIAPRTAWAEATVSDGDRLEIVHFVGGGAG